LQETKIIKSTTGITKDYTITRITHVWETTKLSPVL